MNEKSIGVTEDNQLLESRIKIVIAEYEKRTKKKFVRKEAAKKLKITPPYLSAIISGDKKNVDTEILFALADMLECKVDDFYEYVRDKDDSNNSTGIRSDS